MSSISVWGQVLSGNLQSVQGVGALAPPTERASAYLDIAVAMRNWSTKFVDVYGIQPWVPARCPAIAQAVLSDVRVTLQFQPNTLTRSAQKTMDNLRLPCLSARQQPQETMR